MDIPVMSILVPFSLESAPPPGPPSYLTRSTKLPRSLCTTYVKRTPKCIPALIWALDNSHAVDIDVRSDLTESDTLWEDFEEYLTAATAERQTPIVLCELFQLYDLLMAYSLHHSQYLASSS